MEKNIWGNTLVSEKITKNTFLIVSLILIIPLVSCNVLGATISVSNSEKWTDVYSVMLDASLNDNKAAFISSKTLGPILKNELKNKEVNIYSSEDEPFISTLESQVNSLGYNVNSNTESGNFNLDLDPQNGNYYVISEYNPKISVAIASLALKKNYWVLIVNEDNLNEIENRLSDANNVVAVGEFRRDFIEVIEPYITDRINNKNPFEDSIDIAERNSRENNIIMSDGTFIEEEFFSVGSPVLLSGRNKLSDSIYDFLKENNVDSVTIIGNELTVIGEQIREKSNKEISVFIKYGQGTATKEGSVYALSEFPLPSSQLAITISKSIYDPDKNILMIYFQNLGNTGLYELTSLSIKTDEDEIGTASDEEPVFLGAGETVPISYEIDLPSEEITENTIVEYYTSFGIYPTQLDNFLTMEDEYGPPFRTKLIIESIEDDTSSVDIVDAAYYEGLNRVGVTLMNNGTSEVYYSVKIEDIIISGLEENLFKEDSIKAGEEKTTYISAQLDEIDIQENEKFNIDLRYGIDPDSKFNSLNKELPFKVEKGSFLTGFAIGSSGSGSLMLVVIVIAIVIAGAGYFIYIKKKK